MFFQLHSKMLGCFNLCLGQNGQNQWLGLSIFDLVLSSECLYAIGKPTHKYICRQTLKAHTQTNVGIYLKTFA